MTKTRQQNLINRINELHDELRSLGVEPEKEKLSSMSEDELIETGKAIREQIETRRKFLARKK